MGQDPPLFEPVEQTKTSLTVGGYVTPSDTSGFPSSGSTITTGDHFIHDTVISGFRVQVDNGTGQEYTLDLLNKDGTTRESGWRTGVIWNDNDTLEEIVVPFEKLAYGIEFTPTNGFSNVTVGSPPVEAHELPAGEHGHEI
jgi:hypothetical protein